MKRITIIILLTIVFISGCKIQVQNKKIAVGSVLIVDNETTDDCAFSENVEKYENVSFKKYVDDYLDNSLIGTNKELYIEPLNRAILGTYSGSSLSIDGTVINSYRNDENEEIKISADGTIIGVAFWGKSNLSIKDSEVSYISNEKLISIADMYFNSMVSEKEIYNKPEVRIGQVKYWPNGETRVFIDYYVSYEAKYKGIKTGTEFVVHMLANGDVVCAEFGIWSCYNKCINNEYDVDLENMKIVINEKCKPIVDSINEKEWLMFDKITIGEVEITYALIDGETRLVLKAEVSVDYWYYYDETLAEKYQMDKAESRAEQLTFVRILEWPYVKH